MAVSALLVKYSRDRVGLGSAAALENQSFALAVRPVVRVSIAGTKMASKLASGL